MSDLAVLSHHYKASTDLAMELNQTVVALKKRFYGLAGNQDVSEEQMTSYRGHLAEFLSVLLAELGSLPEQASNHSRLSIPASIIDRVRQAHKGTMPYYVEDLTSVRERLSQEGEALSEADIQLLDQLAAIAGLDSAEVFRRMWRKR